MPYHVLVVPREHPTDVAYSLDLTEQQVIERVQRPYESGGALVVSGRTIRPGDIKEVQISCTEDPSAVVLLEVRRILASSRSIVNQLMPPQRWMITDHRFSEDVTDRFLIRPMPDVDRIAEGDVNAGRRGEGWLWPLIAAAVVAVLAGAVLRAMEELAWWVGLIVAVVVFALIVAVYAIVRHRRRAR
jgi:uncharacterized membrane protein YeaQ/YmgE (transglycosylase-associated protein family)